MAARLVSVGKGSRHSLPARGHVLWGHFAIKKHCVHVRRARDASRGARVRLVEAVGARDAHTVRVEGQQPVVVVHGDGRIKCRVHADRFKVAAVARREVLGVPRHALAPAAAVWLAVRFHGCTRHHLDWLRRTELEPEGVRFEGDLVEAAAITQETQLVEARDATGDGFNVARYAKPPRLDRGDHEAVDLRAKVASRVPCLNNDVRLQRIIILGAVGWRLDEAELGSPARDNGHGEPRQPQIWVLRPGAFLEATVAVEYEAVGSRKRFPQPQADIIAYAGVLVVQPLAAKRRTAVLEHGYFDELAVYVLIHKLRIRIKAVGAPARSAHQHGEVRGARYNW
mmetsp:Transcript_22800/g.77571  ORF Transcript_22800/g.77571 Transcript_22800/m.77571 type:complete len:340 (-) Transcript_22800:362-1381(-)